MEVQMEKLNDGREKTMKGAERIQEADTLQLSRIHLVKLFLERVKRPV